ncbi:hypothetical protein GGP41_006326 [Bipolaris sorokiniana]|uniref:Endo-1,4-beta-xylanase n=2 Tax=Cochliobolus sativus TaxID=45130 RepID=A0A8H5ZHT5_COCSA|nr:glycoside hydrolase family 11 protein [Bipolaris sorokiniana ND90Pr]EMD66236.1 glycoside hydrolase family 11 protein [Bipolaris sorokiniana ND90Pr]KAF5849460.1 hypothetical protein GGP41_006326 [Bipolaris sorokiniana]
MVAFTSVLLGLSAIGSAFAAPVADVPDFELSATPKHLAARQDYNQNYKTGGNIQYNPTNNGYSVTFSGAQDFVLGKGWRQGTTRTVKYSGSTTAQSGTVLVALYGWTKGSKLVEYYIQDFTSGGSGSAQGQKMGQVTCDGSVYDIWKHTQVNQPSIVGTTTFVQYISNRVNKRSNGGTITTKCHFDAWAKLGMTLGNQMDYQTISTEGWGNAAGKSQYTVSSA